MPKKYRLVRTAPGVLDLSQLLDEQGRPVLLKALDDFVVVNETTAKHPLIARFVNAGLRIQEISLTPHAPATPAVETVMAPPAPLAPSVIVPPAPPEETVPSEDVAEPIAPATPEATTVDDKLGKKSKKYSR